MMNEEVLYSLWKNRHPYDAYFLEIIKGYSIVKNGKTHVIVKDNKSLFVIDLEISVIHIKYEMWKNFNNKFGYENLTNILLLLIEKYFNYKGLSTYF